MRIALAYVHMHQSYLGGLFKRAAKRLGIEVVSLGPRATSWVYNAPVEEGWEPDRTVDEPGACLSVWAPGGHFDALINVDQGDGFYLTEFARTPTAHVFTEGNPGEYDRARRSGASAVWSCMPLKDEGRLQAGLHHLDWGYDVEHTRVETNLFDEHRPFDVSFRGSSNAHRDQIVSVLKRAGLTVDAGPPLSRTQWGVSLEYSKFSLCDHDQNFLTGRIVDSMAAGAVVLALAQPCMDLLAPRGYVPVARGADGRPDPQDVADVARAWLLAPQRRYAVAQRARDAVRGLSWDDQLLRILGSVGVRLAP